MTTTVAEAAELIDLARALDRRLVASPGEVLRPQLSAIRELIAGGPSARRAGPSADVRSARITSPTSSQSVSRPPGASPSTPAGTSEPPEVGHVRHDRPCVAPAHGGARAGLQGDSDVEPGRARAGVHAEIPTEVDDNTIALLEFGGGMTAVVHGTAAGTVIDDFAAAIYFGTAGTISGVLLDGEPFEFQGRELTLDSPTDDWNAQMRVLPHVTGPHRELPESHVFEDIMQLVDLVGDGTPTSVTAEHARHVIEIIEAAYRSARTGRTQSLETSFEFPPAWV